MKNRVYINSSITTYTLNNKLHREDGPAYIQSNGDKSWWLNGKLHREDGPAVEYTNGYKAWYLNDKVMSQKEHAEATKK